MFFIYRHHRLWKRLLLQYNPYTNNKLQKAVQWRSRNLVLCITFTIHVKIWSSVGGWLLWGSFFILGVRRAFAWFDSPSLLCILFNGSIATESSRTSSTKYAHFSPFLLISKSSVCSCLYFTPLIYALIKIVWQLKPHASLVMKSKVAYLGFQIASKIRTKEIKIITIL